MSPEERPDPPIPPEAAQADAWLREHRADLRFLLMGPGSHGGRELRSGIGERLEDEGYDIVVMEAIDSLPGEGLEDKWNRIHDRWPPDHYFLVVPSGVEPGGETFEGGWIAARAGSDLPRILHFFVEDGIELQHALDPYLEEQTQYCFYTTYRDEGQLRRRIQRRIDNLLLERYLEQHG